MAILGKWSGNVVSILPGTSWAAPNALFPTQDRNDFSTYSFASATSILTLPSTIVADGYLLVASYELQDTSSGRSNPQGRIIRASGTGTFVGTPTGGFVRDASEDRSYVRCWAFVDNPSGSSTFQFQWKRDTDAPTGGTERSEFLVIPFYYSDIGIYSSGSAALYGGTTPNVVTGFTGTDGTDITIASNVVSVTGDNKRYLILSSQFFEGRGGRTQRWHGLDIDGTQEDAAKAYSYYRNTANDESGDLFTWLIETITATITIEQTCYRGDGISNLQGGANFDGSTPAVGDHSLVVIELNDTAEVFRSRDTNQSALLATTGPVDLDPVETLDFNDSASFTKAVSSSINVVQTGDCLFGANVSAASNAVTVGTRWTAYAELTINGTEDADSVAGDYLRNNQSSQDTFGWSANLLGFQALTAGDDVGVSVTELVGSEGGGAAVSPANWTGFWGINLDTMEDVGGAANLSPPLFTNANIFYAPTAAHVKEFQMKSGAGAEGDSTERLGMDQTFGGGKFGETVAELPTVDLGAGEDREDVFSMEATISNKEREFEFRVVYDDVVADVTTLVAKITVGSAGQSLTPGLFTNVNIFYAPTITTGAVALTPGLFNETNIFYAPTIGGTYGLQLSGLINAANIFYAPTVSAGAVDLTPGLFTETNIFYTPAITTGAVALTPGLFTETNIFYAPEVAQGGAPQDLTPGLFTNVNIFYVPTVTRGAVGLTPSLFQEINIFYAPTVAVGAVDLAPARFDETNIFYTPAVTTGAVVLTPARFDETNIFYGSTVVKGAVDLTPSRFNETNIFYVPSIATGVVDLTPGLFTNVNIFNAHILTQDGGPQFLVPDLFQETNVFYAPTITTGAVGLTPSRFDETNIFYAPTAAVGAVELTPGLFQETNIFYGATVAVASSTQDLTPSRFDNTNIFYSVVLTGGGSIQPDFNISLIGGGASGPTGFDKYHKKRKRVRRKVKWQKSAEELPVLTDTVVRLPSMLERTEPLAPDAEASIVIRQELATARVIREVDLLRPVVNDAILVRTTHVDTEVELAAADEDDIEQIMKLL